MKSNLLKRIIAVSIISTSLLAILPTRALASWKYDNTGWWYTEGDSWSVGWRYINGNWYYFNTNGYMKKGWLNENGTWYYTDSNGAMQIGIVQVDGKTYCLASSGAMLTGNINYNGQMYKFSLSGEAIGGNIPQAVKAFSKEGITTTPIEVKKADNIQQENKTDNSLNSSSNNHHSSNSSSNSNNSNVRQYKVNLSSEGISQSWNYVVNENNTIKLPNISREGYILKGWYSDYDGTEFTEKIPVTSNLKLHAEWYTDSSNLETKIIDEIHFNLQTPIVGNTPKNVKVSNNSNYNVIATQWESGDSYQTIVNEVEPEDIYKDGYYYKATILLKAGYGYKFKNKTLWFAGYEGKKVFVNDKGIMPEKYNGISGNSIMQIELYYERPIKSNDSNIDTNVELNNEIDFSVDDCTNIDKEDKSYITIIYDKDTLEIESLATGIQNKEEGYERLIVERNLENWYAFNNTNEYQLIDDNGTIKWAKKYESPITVYYNKKTLEIKEIKKGVHNIWGMTAGDVNRYDYECITVDAKKYGTTNSIMYKHKEDYKIVKDGSEIKLEKKDDNNTLDDSNLQNGQTTPSAVTVSIL